MTNVVLDTSAVMAWLQQEPGWEAVGRVFATENCRMSAVDLAELVAKSAERKGIKTLLTGRLIKFQPA